MWCKSPQWEKITFLTLRGARDILARMLISHLSLCDFPEAFSSTAQLRIMQPCLLPECRCSLLIICKKNEVFLQKV